MLITCPECELPVSDKAEACPHCGIPLKKSSKRRTTAHMRLPNGFGQITELKGRRLRNPFRVMVTVGKTDTGKPICKLLKPVSYFSTYNEAYMALAEYNKNPYDLGSILTVEELYDKWTDKYFKNINDSSIRTIRSAWNYCDGVKKMQARDVRVGHIKSCMDNCDKESMKPRIKSMFNLMLDFGVEYGLLDKNYARDFKSERSVNITDHMVFSDEEIAILWDHTNIPLVNVVLLQCYTGWRPQELCKMKYNDVDLNEMTMTGGMKTDAGKNRTIPIHSKVQEIVRLLKNVSGSYGSEWFICDKDGSEFTYDKYNKRFHKLMSQLGLNEAHRPHDPRKTFITWAKNKGMDEYAIKRIVGHSIDDLTERVYTERSIEWLRKEIEKI